MAAADDTNMAMANETSTAMANETNLATDETSRATGNETRVPWKTARKRARNQKSRKGMRDFGQFLIQNQQETRDEIILLQRSRAEAGTFQVLCNLLEKTLKFDQPKSSSILSEANKHFESLKFLEANLVFKRVKADEKNPLRMLKFGEGMRISKKLGCFLRHNLPEGQFSTLDGSVPISVAEKSIGFPVDKIFLAVSPEYDTGKKRRFVVLENCYPDSSVKFRIAALGSHTEGIFSPPGHYSLGKESLQQLCPLFHNTSSVQEIKEDGFLSQQQRQGGINLCAKVGKYRLKSSHEIMVDAQTASKKGYEFFGNRFCEVIYAMGKWEGNAWSGKIPMEFLRIKKR